MKKTIQKLTIASLLASISLVASAAELPFKSADFGFEGETLLSSVSKDSLSKSGDVLYCRADISVEGQAERANCFAKSSSIQLVVDSEQALQRLAFSPASVEGKNIPVRMSFRVAYTPVGDATVVSLIPNLGTMQAQFGRDYVAPQERLDVSDWFERYSDNSWVGGQEFLGKGDMARVSAIIDQNGKPSRLQTVAAKRAHERDADVVKNTIKHSRFIPGTANGRVVPMQYMVAVHYEDRNEAYANAE